MNEGSCCDIDLGRLKECPFCGSTDAHLRARLPTRYLPTGYLPNWGMVWSVFCPVCLVETCGHVEKRLAYNDWQRRAGEKLQEKEK
jgi:hypothetical protein